MIAFKKKALLSLAIAGLVSTQANAASINGAMDLKVTMPEILVLYHFDEVEIDLSAGATQEAVSEGNELVTGSTTITPVTGALSIDGAPTAAGSTVGTTNTVQVTLNNAWAVRSISSGDVTVSGTIENDTLTHASESGSTIGISEIALTATDATGGSGNEVTLNPQWAVQTGNISFELDLTSASHAGDYSSGATGTDTFLLELRGI